MNALRDAAWPDLRGLVIPACLVGAAEVLALASDLQSDTLAAPHAILIAGFGACLDGSILRASLQTLAMALAGLLTGGSIGLLVGIAIGLSRTLNDMLDFTIELVRPVPSVALIPLSLLVYGFGYRMEIVIVAFAALWPMLVLTRAAIRGLDPRLLEVARVLRFGRVATIVKFIVPAMLPRVFVAFRLAMGVALIVAVTVEIAVNPLGLGAAMMEAEQALRPEVALAFLVWIGLLGWLLDAGLGAVQRRCFAAPGPGAHR